MAFDPTDLERLASHLETKADTATALAQEHAKSREISDAGKQTARAKNARYYAEVCRHAARLLKVRIKRKSFIPPTWEELIDFTKEKHPEWPHVDVERWFNHFESVGWKVGNGKPMVDWKKAAHNGFSNWKQKNPQNGNGNGPGSAQILLSLATNHDPKEWPEFLKRFYPPQAAADLKHRYASDWLKAEFSKWLKST